MALESVRYRMPDGVKLTFSPAGEPIVVHVDNLRLQQLLTNLLTNAAKFTEKGEINLSFQLAPDREKVCIAVTDTGAGIPLEKPITARERLAFGIPKTIDEGESPCGRGQPDEKRFSR